MEGQEGELARWGLATLRLQGEERRLSGDCTEQTGPGRSSGQSSQELRQAGPGV